MIIKVHELYTKEKRARNVKHLEKKRNVPYLVNKIGDFARLSEEKWGIKA